MANQQVYCQITNRHQWGQKMKKIEGEVCCKTKMVKKKNDVIKGSLDEKLPIYEQDPKSKRIDSPENRFVRQ